MGKIWIFVILLMVSFTACAATEPSDSMTMVVKEITSAEVYPDGGSIAIVGRLDSGKMLQVTLDLSLNSKSEKSQSYNRITINGKLEDLNYERHVLGGLFNWLTSSTKYSTWEENVNAYLKGGQSDEAFSRTIVVGSLFERICAEPRFADYNQVCRFFRKK